MMSTNITELVLKQSGVTACEPCTQRLQQLLLAKEGICEVEVDPRSARLRVQYDDKVLSLPQVQTLITSIEADLGEQIGHETLLLTGLDCADCATTLERGVKRLPGLLAIEVNFARSKMHIEYEVGKLNRSRLEQRIQQLGYGVIDAPAAQQAIVITGHEQDEQREDSSCGDTCCVPTPTTAPLLAKQPPSFWRRSTKLRPSAISAVLWGIAFVVSRLAFPVLLGDLLYAAAIAIGGYPIARRGLIALLRGRTLGIDLLMTVAVIGAALIGQWAEGAAVVVLFSLGEALEGLTMDRVRNSIRSLIDLSPREATVKTAEGEQRLPVEQLMPGDIVVIRPGERVAADGRGVSGSTTINQAPITGESLPVEKALGDEVYAGTINAYGAIEVEVTRRAQETMLAKIIHLVEEAQGSKAPSQRFVDTFARYYTPAILSMAVLVAALPPLFGALLLPWLYKALVLLVIACPCALVISTPVSIVAAIGRASRSGVLIKGGTYLEAMGGIKVLAFDKTGTLTKGRPVVTAVVPLAGLSAREILALTAAVESRSEHPLAQAILQYAKEQGVRWSEPTTFEALPGRGARACIDGAEVVVGKPILFEGVGEDIQARMTALQQEGNTVLLVAQAGTLIGMVAVADEIRPAAKQVVSALKQVGMRSVVMLTGDNERSARAVSQRLGIDEVRANLLPNHKTDAIKELLARHGAVAMVGDGINDAPALAQATVGIAMGAAGSDTALETADVALMADDLSKLPKLIRLSRATLRTIYTNITFSLVVKAIFLALTLLGEASLWLAILADTGAALVVIVYGMRLLRFREGKPLVSAESETV